MSSTDHSSAPAASSDADARLRIGSVIDDRYRIHAQLGEGGMGIVYRAEHMRLGRPVAMKILRRQLAGGNDMGPRFEREARALAALTHPNVVTVTDYGMFEGHAYLVMELIEGRSLRQVLDEDRPEPERALDILRQTLDGLAVAHAQGLAHRDLKPANIMLQQLPGGREHAKILDFGFAKFLAGDESGDAELTQSGVAFGTPAYMAPEQASGAPTDARTDIYTMGVLAFEMLSGRPPFEGDVPEVVRQHIAEDIPPLRATESGRPVSLELEGWVARAMAKKPAERFDDAGAMRAALDAIAEPFAPRPESSTDAMAPTVRAPADEISRTDGSASQPTVQERPPAQARGDDEPAASVRGLPAERKRRSGRGFGCVALLVLLGGGAGAVYVLEPDLLSSGQEELSEVAGEAREKLTAGSPTLGERHGRIEGPGGAGDEAAAEGEGEAATEGEAGAEGAAEAGAESEAEGEGEAEGETQPQSAEEALETEQAVENPWVAGGPLPKWVRRMRGRLYSGRRASDGAIRAIRKHARSNREDPRPSLLLAQAYMSRGWLSDAIERYELAVEIDPGARGDPRMSRNLITLVAREPQVADDAADAVVEIYGDEARDDVDRALRLEGIDEDGKARLKRLRRRL